MLAAVQNHEESEPEVTGIKRLILTQFRNHARLEINTKAKINVLFGPNGAGKTNILEAISILNSGRGLRSAETLELSRNADDGGSFAIAAVIGKEEDERRIGVGIDTQNPSRKIARLNGKDVATRTLMDSLRVIWLTPAMDRLFAGAQSERRKFLDRLVVTFYPETAQTISDYEKLLRERNKVLEFPNPDTLWLDNLEKQIAIAAFAIAIARNQAVSALQNAIDTRPESMFPKSQLFLEGEIEQKALEGETATQIEGFIFSKLKENRTLDKAMGRTMFGTHKTQFNAMHKGNGMMAEKCSTGEQKSLIVGLILAQSQLIANGLKTHDEDCFGAPNPIILLDEAFAHFDENRREGLASELLNTRAQVWLTGTDKGLFEIFGKSANYYKIAANQAISEQ